MCAKINNALELIRNEIAQKRSAIQNLDERLFAEKGESRSKMIEISGSSNSGKTQLLYYIMSRCVMPLEFGGNESRAVCIDMKNKFNPEVLLRQIENLITEKSRTGTGNTSTENELDAEHITQIGLNCLKAIQVLYCYSPDELALALEDVQNMLIEDANGDIIFLAIDGLDAFYWIENFERKQRMRTHYGQLKESLHAISIPNNITCAYTVDINYLQGKHESAMGMTSDYKMVLKWKPGAERTLNGLNIDINKYGLQFL